MLTPLGARLVLSSLDSLNNNQIWNNNNFKIASVYLMGAAVDDDEVSKNAADAISSDGLKSAYGNAIEEEVSHFYNLFNPEDDALEPGNEGLFWYYCWNHLENQPIYYPCFEQDLALGQAGKQSSISNINTPQTYEDIPVQQEIPNIRDADADRECDLEYPILLSATGFVCTITHAGDNHLGYAGFRNYSDGLRNNGAMDILVDTLNS